MSCFIVTDKLLNDTINFIGHNIKGDNFGSWISRETFNDVMITYDHNPIKGHFLEYYCESIQIANVKSWNTRYPNDKVILKDYPVYSYRYDYKVISIAQFLLNIDCIIYQLCEVENFKDSDIYQDLIQTRHTATTLIDGYAQAKWGY